MFSGRKHGERLVDVSGPGIPGSGCTPVVPLTWLQQPTLTEVNGIRPIAGTSFFQPAIRPLSDYVESQWPQVEVFTVQLAVVPAGEFVGSVGVYANGRRVGSIPSELSDSYREVVRGLTESGRPATCRATLGGALEDTTRTVGVGALLPGKASENDGSVFLPPMEGCRVTVTDAVAAELDRSIKSRAKTHTDRRVGVIDPLTGHVSLDGIAIGSLTNPRWSMEAVRAAVAAGFPTSCMIRLVRQPNESLRVVADLP